VGRVRVGCCIRAPEPETRTLNPTRTRTCNRVEYYPRTRTRRGPETRWVTRDPKNRNTEIHNRRRTAILAMATGESASCWLLQEPTSRGYRAPPRRYREEPRPAAAGAGYRALPRRCSRGRAGDSPAADGGRLDARARAEGDWASGRGRVRD
jgi:hypothetical protein